MTSRLCAVQAIVLSHFPLSSAVLLLSVGCLKSPHLDPASMSCQTDDNCLVGYTCVAGACQISANTRQDANDLPQDTAVADKPMSGKDGVPELTVDTSIDLPLPRLDMAGSGESGGTAQAGGAGGSTGGAGGTARTGGAGGSTGGTTGTGGTTVFTGGTTGAGGTTVSTSGTTGTVSTGGTTGTGGTTVFTGGTTGTGGTTVSTGGTTGTGGTTVSTDGTTGTGGTTVSTGGTTVPSQGLPGDVARAAGTPFVAAHAMTRALFASYIGPLFKALRDSDKKEADIGVVPATGLVDLAALGTFCSGTTCKVTTLYDQSGNGNDMWRGDTAANSPMESGEEPKLCDLMAIDYWQLSDGTKIPVVVETGDMWKAKAQCLRNRDKTKNMPTGPKPQTTYAIFHAKYLNNNCCFNYGNTGKMIHYAGPGTLSALNFSKITFWSKGTGNGPWVMVSWEQGVYAGNIGKCSSGIPVSVECTTTGENPNPSVTFDIVTTLFKHDGVNHWAAKYGNAKSGTLAVGIDLPSLPKGYSPLKQEGGLGLGEGGAGDPSGTGGFSEGAVMAAETTDATDNAIQKSIVSVYGK
jgi:non-reducing end alpha-L-arabinofuranosidase